MRTRNCGSQRIQGSTHLDARLSEVGPRPPRGAGALDRNSFAGVGGITSVTWMLRGLWVENKTDVGVQALDDHDSLGVRGVRRCGAG